MAAAYRVRVAGIWKNVDRLLRGAKSPVEVSSHEFLIMSIILVI